MTRLAWTFLRSGGWRRAALLAGTTAVATALLLAALRMLRLAILFGSLSQRSPAQPDRSTLGLAFGTAMLVLPLLLMLNQVVRLGTAARERRLAALRLAGATPAQVRRLGALEVGFPVTVGAMAGPLAYALLRALSSAHRSTDFLAAGNWKRARLDSYGLLRQASVIPPWWQTVAVVALAAAAGVATGALASRHLIASPLGVSRRVRRSAPRPWGLLLVATGLGAMAFGVSSSSPRSQWLWAVFFPAFGPGQSVVLPGILLVVLGVIALGPWVAFRAGQRAARRTSDPATLIAAGHLVSDPGPAGRAAVAVGAIGVVSGLAAVLEGGLFSAWLSRPAVNHFSNNLSLLILLALVVASLILVLIVTASTLAVHAAESLVDRRRILAALVAAGTPVSVLRDALRREAMLACMPLSVGGVLLGAVVASVAFLTATNAAGTHERLNLAALLFLCGQVVATVGLTWAAIRIATGAVAPRLQQATAPANLRTG